MVYDIPGTSAAWSDVTGRTYSSRKRAEYAERLSVEKKRTGAAPKRVDWKDLPTEIRKHERTGSNEFVHTMNEVGWDPVDVRKLLSLYDEDETSIDGSPAWVLGVMLRELWPDKELSYVEMKDGSREWIIVKSEKSSDSSAEVEGTETGLRAGI